jgi:hypothetical protein
MKTIIAIDPASRITGIAILQGPKVWSMLMKAQTTAEIDAYVLACLAAFGPEVEFVLEDQYLAEHKDPTSPTGRGKINWPSIVTLVVARVRWQTIAELRGVKVSLANTGAWQGAMHATAKKLGPDGKKLNRKQRSKLVVRATWHNIPRIEQPADVADPELATRPADKATNDEADAILIGRYHQLYGATQAPAPKPKAKRPRPTRKRDAAPCPPSF